MKTRRLANTEQSEKPGRHGTRRRIPALQRQIAPRTATVFHLNDVDSQYNNGFESTGISLVAPNGDYTKLQFGTAQLNRDSEGERPMLPFVPVKAILLTDCITVDSVVGSLLFGDRGQTRNLQLRS
jgi:hypothetical protein